ncbi:hypothetical protein HELRODRAFT_176962 [Helobdella robusta]|uniref:SPT2 homolog N-terminal domain-containing protein n=1 Tax=Helobdella robusta TaxID=6412 RepID=T1FB26_HELRO|nr:hypothetical protein HELRODRAFT_176962 [Helobdella robusta]ESN98486.1 hypothetical protein HELRODRAFT_176962 [Helobdella robusta]
MDYKDVLKVAAAKQQQLLLEKPNPLILNTKLGPPKKEERQKGIKSESVKAFLEKLEKDEKKPAATPTNKPTTAPTTLKPAVAPKTLSSNDEEIDMRNLFKTKRQAHVPDEFVPNMLELLKEKKRLKEAKLEEEKLVS